MEGIEVNFDTCIGKWLSKLADTVTRLAETQNNTEEYERNTYPEKAKQIIIKTRNNLRDQLGFKQINKNASNQKSSVAAKKMTIHNEVVSRNLLPSLISPLQKKTFIESKTGINSHRSGSQHSRSKSGDFVNFRRYSLSNDDFNLSYYNYKPNEFNDVANTPINENDSDEILFKNASLDNPNYEVYDDKATSHSPSPQPQQQQQIANTTSAIDFKLEIKIEISSGKWILHASKLTNANEMPPDNFYFDYPNTHNQLGQNRSLFNRFDQSSDADMRNTNFIFPAIKVKAFYESSHKTIENRLSKKANLYALIRLDSLVMPAFNNKDFKKDPISREMCISPALLDFLEQTLEPLDTLRSSLESASRITTPLNKLQKDQQSTLKSQKDNLKPDVINEDILATDDTPIKRNSSGDELTKESPPRAAAAASEGAAYFPIEVVAFVSMQPSSIRFTCLPQSTMECVLKLPTLEMVFSTYKSIDSSIKENIYNDLNNGLHDNISSPQNFKENDLDSAAISKSLVKGSEKGGLSVTCSMTDFSLKFYNRLAIIKHNNDPKDYRYEHSNEKDSLSVRVEFIRINISRSRKLSTKEADDPFIKQHDIASSRLSFHQNIITYNDVELSVLADIGTSSFIYDMRNIKEVFIFPRIWYRRSLARRLFLGEESSSLPAYKSATSTSNLNNNNNLNNSNGFLYKNDLKSNSAVSLNEKGRPKSMIFNMEQENSYCVNSKWKTLVLIAVNLSDFEVKMNIGSVMGNVRLFAKNAKTKSRISISSFGKKSMLLNFVLENCRLIAEGGSNGCLFRIQDITSNIEINDKNNETGSPSHKIDFGVAATECRIDCAYNSATPILAFRLSSFTLKLNDSWDLLAIDANKLPEALLEINVVWDQLHLMITKATTPDLIKMFYKLFEFFEKQLNEGKDYIKDFDIFYDSKVKQQFTEKVEPTLKRNFSVNGGNISLKGNNLSLITFNGSNFRAKNWALFSLNEPSLEFACQTYIKNNESVIQENLVFYLGRNIKKSDMATIYKVSNESSHIFARCETISEWFEYAHGSIDAPGLRDFPRFRSDEIEKKIRKKSDPVSWEEIFRLPSLQIFCNSTQENRTVKFEFKTEFHDYILLTIRTELFGFLHELITSYVKEKDKDSFQIKEVYVREAKVDNRDYDCIKWELNPQLRLMPKFGSSVDPPRVDVLLKSLGFNYARTTIPKWFQRGLLDSLNDVLFQLIKIYLKILSDQDLKLKTSTKIYDE